MPEENSESNLDNNKDRNSSQELQNASNDPEDKISSNQDISEVQADKAVEDIVRHESDEVLAAEDVKVGKASVGRLGLFKLKLKEIFQKWWENKRLRYSSLAALIIIILGLALWPPTRDFALNLVGVRASASLEVTDQTTGLPLKDAVVTLAGQRSQTNDSGVAKLYHLRLGNQKIQVQKEAFAEVTKSVYVGLGQNKLGSFALKAVGVQYNFEVTDYLSGKPIQKAEAASGKADAVSDKNGKIILTALSTKAFMLSVTISANGYLNNTVSVPVGSAAVTNVQLVPSGNEVYVSNSSGRYNLYKININGQGKQLLLAGTGYENANIGLVVSPDGKEAALVSTRDDMRDQYGYLLSALTLVNVTNGTYITIDHAQQIQLAGWSGTKLIYEEIAAGASAANPKRERIMSYDYTINARYTLATANGFNGFTYDNGVVYYAIANAPSAQVAFFKVNADGTDNQAILNQQVWSIFRTNYNTLYLQTPGSWYSYTLGAKLANPSQVPANQNDYYFVDNSAATQSLWIDTRDGKGTLLLHDNSTGKDTTLASQGGLTQPVRWLNSSVAIYRVSTPQETADYAVSINGGSPKKIVDVTGTSGYNTYPY